MKRMNVIGCVVVASVFALISACTDDSSGQPQVSSGDQAGWMREDPSTVPPGSSDEHDLTGSVPGGDVTGNATNCSIVQFCNAPGADGARCLQRGCTLAAAQAECTRETQSICGAHPTCPWIFVASNGDRFLNGSCL